MYQLCKKLISIDEAAGVNYNQPKLPAATLAHQSGGLTIQVFEWTVVDCIQVLIKVYQNSWFYF